MNIKLLFLLFWSSLVFCQIPLDNQVYQLNEFNDTLSITDAIEKEKQGAFNIPFKIETYKFIKNKEANWICLNIPKQKETQYLSIENSLFEELDFHLYNNNQVSIPKNLKETKQYRFPIIEIKADKTPAKLFIRTKDALSFRTEFNIKNYNKTSLLKTTEREHFFIGGYVISLFVLLISACVFFMYKKQYAVLWYGLHLSILIVEYLISSGIFSQWFVPNSIIMKYGLDHISLFLSTMALFEFLRSFFPFTAKTMYCKQIYFAFSVICLIGAIYSVIDGLCGNIFNVEVYAQNLLNYGSIITLIVHGILVYHRVIPLYLFMAFLMPILGILANTGGFKESFESPVTTYILFQAVYIGILIEVMVIIFYIIKQSVDGELKAVELTEENNKLKYDFQESLSENQEKHQNAILSDVHDSFGGYLEALKLTFINKNIKDKSIDKILESFSKEYRLLLNSLYIPNIDTENLTSAIQEYCDKMNAVSDIEISFEYSKDTYVDIPQNIAKFIFKASSELTTNAIKYAKPNYIKVKLHLSASIIALNVEDDGIGFEQSSIKKSSYGIQGIKERITLFKGEIHINSESNKGTHVQINIPIPEAID